MAYHILADAETILGFGFAGVTGTAVESATQAKAGFATLVSDPKLKILLVSQPVAAWIDDLLTEHRLTSAPPYVVEIPDLWNTHVERQSLVEMIQQAVGVKISGGD